MKGLLIKDYKLGLMLNTGSIFDIVFLAIVCLALVIADVDSRGGLSGTNFIIVLASVGVRGYDVYDNGLSYLFTLPVTRRGYVREAYLFALLSSCVLLLAFSLIDVAIEVILPGVSVDTFAVVCGVMWDAFKSILLMTAFLIPFYFFFGAKKRNQYILIAVSIVIMFVILYESMPLYEVITKGVKLFKEFPVTLLLLIVSYMISVKIMERKDF